MIAAKQQFINLEANTVNTMPQRLTIREMQIIAEQKGGRCLSNKYHNTGTKLLWKCEKGHRFYSTPGSIRSIGTWCPVCANNIPLTIKQMHLLATVKGGKCLSKHYKNSKIKLLWQCEKGHKWKATPFSIKNRNSWCPVCANNQPKQLKN